MIAFSSQGSFERRLRTSEKVRVANVLGSLAFFN